MDEGSIPPMAPVVHVDLWKSSSRRVRLSGLPAVGHLRGVEVAGEANSKSRYWDWTLDAANIEASPLFDGSPYSMSGNGKAIPGRADVSVSIDLPLVKAETTIPVGTGGGCVITGPFANLEVPFGTVTNSLDTSYVENPKNLDYKPHCLRRDLNPRIASTALQASSVDALLQTPNITSFTNILDRGPDQTTLNVHAGGHFGTSSLRFISSMILSLLNFTQFINTGVGLDMSDTFSSPGDPIFFLHHAQIDRIWALWQQKDLASRQYAITGTGTFFNYPPSPDVKITDKIDLGKLSPGGPSPIKDFMDTKRGPFCYEYVWTRKLKVWELIRLWRVEISVFIFYFFVFCFYFLFALSVNICYFHFCIPSIPFFFHFKNGDQVFVDIIVSYLHLCIYMNMLKHSFR